jgi:hypothetical protein
MAESEKQSMAEPEKPNIKEQLAEITARIEDGIKDLFQSDKYAQYLKTMSRFHNYSFNNTMLIYLQKPNATAVAGFKAWQEQFERQVKKGEKGIRIIAPSPYKKKISEPKLDPDTDLPLKDKDGKIIYEETVIRIPAYRPVSVFDVSQTYGKPLPTIVSSLDGTVEHYDAFIEAVKRTSPVPIDFKPLREGLDGFFDASAQSITLREGMSEIQTVCAAIHEIGHAKLHNYEKQKEETAQRDENAEPPKPKDRRTEEVEAESVAFAVCAYFGIETGENSFGYIATWSQSKELTELKSSLDTIRQAASEIINGVEDNFQEVCKERGIDLSGEVKSEDIPEIPSDSETERLYLIDNSIYLHLQTTDSGYDYTLYDKETMKEIDGGQLDSPQIPFSYARQDVCKLHDIKASSIDIVSLDLLENLTDSQAKAAEPERTVTIYQLNDTKEASEMRFMRLDYIKNSNLSIDVGKYNEIYTCPMKDGESLEDVFARFNVDRPADFKGHSLSVSDVVSIRENGKDTAYFIDCFGFKEIPDFFKDKTVKEKKPSVLKQLKDCKHTVNKPKTAPKPHKSKETEVL